MDKEKCVKNDGSHKLSVTSEDKCWVFLPSTGSIVPMLHDKESLSGLQIFRFIQTNRLSVQHSQSL